jgi:hypothetical protein
MMIGMLLKPKKTPDAIGACCAKCAYADALGMPADCASDAAPDAIGSLLHDDSMIFARRLNDAIASLSMDILAAHWTDTRPQLVAAFDVWREEWSRFFPTTQSRHAMIVGLDETELSRFREDFEKWRLTYKGVEGKLPSGPDPQPLKPGENKPEINIGFGGGLGFGLVALAGLLYLLGSAGGSVPRLSSPAPAPLPPKRTPRRLRA